MCIRDSPSTTYPPPSRLAFQPDGTPERDRATFAVRVEVTAGLPGKVTTNAPARDGDQARWSPQLGQTIQLEASGSALRLDPGLVTAAAGALTVVAIALAVALRRRRRRR